MLRLCLILFTSVACFAQREDWTRPYPAHKITGNLHYVGTEDLACFLIATPEGHILINTGLVDSVPLIRSSMHSLGFKLEDVRILLTMQAHFDHVAGMAEIQKLTKARMYAMEGDAAALEDGGKSDPALKNNQFAPIKVDRRIKNSDTVRLGGTELRVISTPGHTRGSVSYSMNISEDGRTYRV